MPAMTDKAPGSYKMALSSDNKMLAQEGFRGSQDMNARAGAAASEAAAAAAARAEERKRQQEAARLAMIDERRAKPLANPSIAFLNTTKTGAPISGATNSFEVSKVLFVGWQVKFENRLYKLEPNQYRVDAVYIGPAGRTLGAGNDFQSVSPSMRAVTFSGRVGNSRGGAFLPGTYTVNFLLNGQAFAERRLQVVADAGGPDAASPSSGGGAISSSMGTSPASSGSRGMLGPTIATGPIRRLRGRLKPHMHPQPPPHPH